MSKLKNAPLQEAIFEIRWRLQPDENGKQLIDPEYQFALGKFQDALKYDFPQHVAKFPNDFPHQFLNYQVMHQFWSKDKQWPVVQIGPGIATLNDTDQNYDWENTYQPNIIKMLHALSESYENLKFNSLLLRYIDVVRVNDYGFSNWEDFVQDHINFSFQNSFDTRGKLSGLNFEQSFDLEELGQLNFSFSNGQNDKKENIFVWQTAVSKQGNASYEEALKWLSQAHNCASDLFKDICKNNFYASFSK